MHKRSSNQKRPRDLNQLASIIAEIATEEVETEITPEVIEKNPHAAALGRLGGLKGGRARAMRLSAEQRSEIARNAANARWAKKEVTTIRDEGLSDG